MIKCIASDMDGTLLNSMEKISEENARAIKAAQESGAAFVIATGRSYKEVRCMLDEADLNCSVLSLNGAVAYDENGKLISSDPIDVNTVHHVRGLLDTYKLYYEIYTNKGVYTYSKEQSLAILVDILVSAMPHLDPLFIAEKAGQRFESDFMTLIDDYDKLYEVPDMQFYKFLIFSNDNSLLEKIGGMLKQLKQLAVSSSGPGNLEITNNTAQKGIALSRFVSERNIALNDTMAIGDNFNDCSMFERVGKPVAMGNASAEIKLLCGEVTLTNDENGVAHAILKAINK
ncbi:HAD family phosphatase [Bacillus sp. AGMB 02131]|uniref:HAD family phosphatase n=1 Tax=Peribacillus faecalis TaxID=2772559 RepID=A0A927CWR5_9BACI|nr:Cof-type HAD-IIB family hydrolase [Peribacillus faecalis]MBD3107040.1 HAD family phosphatase [Peribacillus faecalis]